jgi:hypothetical protein
MSIPRRAIKNMNPFKKKDVKPKKIKGLGQPQRRIKTIKNSIFDIPMDLSDKRTIYFTAQPKNLNKQLNPSDFTEDNTYDNQIKLKELNFYISSDQPVHQNKTSNAKRKLLIQRYKQAKKRMAKNDALSLEKKNRNMSPLLQKCNNITIQYYDTIKKEFEDFQKKYFIDGTENNIFNFRLNDNKENINTMKEWKSKHENENNPLNIALKKEFNQIYVDLRRLPGLYSEPKKMFLVKDNINDLTKSKSFFEIVQMQLFFVYTVYNNTQLFNKLQNSFLNKRINDESIDEINQKIFQQFKNNNTIVDIEKNIREEIISKLEDEKYQDIYGQEMQSSFSTIYLSTYDDNKFNLVDAVVLYNYIYIEKKLYEFFITTRFDSKEKQKNYLLCLSLINLIDPNLFTQSIELIKAKDKNRYLKKYKKNNNDLLKTRLKDSFTYNKGENLINNPKSFQSAGTLDWFLSENLKYNATAEKELSIPQMYEEFQKNKTPTAHQKYFIQQYDKKEDGIDIYFDTLLKSCSDDKDKKTTFSNGDTSMDLYNGFLKMFMFEMSQYGLNLFMNNKHKDYTFLHDYLISLQNYGHISWLIYNIIHLKNNRTALFCDDKNKFHTNNLKKIIEIHTEKKEEDRIPDTFKNLLDVNDYENADIIIAYLFKTEGIYNGKLTHICEKNHLHQIDFINNFINNPMTCNFNETYNKHFNFMIKRILNNNNNSIDEFNDNFNTLFNKSLILYKNGYLDDNTLNEIKNKHKGITIVNNFDELLNKYNNDPRIFVKKNPAQNNDIIKNNKGWIGNYMQDSLINAFHGVYHVDSMHFLGKASQIIKPFPDFFKAKGDKRFTMNETNNLWPKYSGRPFIFINKEYYEDNQLVRFIKHSDEIVDIISKTKGLFANIPNYWFNYEYLFPETYIEHNNELTNAVDNNCSAYKPLPSTKKIADKTQEQKDQVDTTSKNVDELNKKLDDKLGDETKADDETKTDETKAHDEPAPVLTKQEEILKNYGLKIEKIEPDGDCLFVAFQKFLETNKKKVPDIASLRRRIVKEIKDHWEFFSPFIIGQEEAGKLLYKDKDDYGDKMTATQPDPNAPRARFGDEPEITAFERIYKYKVQVLKWNPEQETMEEIRNFDKTKINDSKTLTLYNTGSKHYDYLRPIIQKIQKGGSFYINKCKNHRHKKTRKFRLKLKLDGDWLHITKPKKKTRRKY